MEDMFVFIALFFCAIFPAGKYQSYISPVSRDVIIVINVI